MRAHARVCVNVCVFPTVCVGSDLVFLLQKFCYSNCSSTQSTAACYSDLAVGLLRIGEEGEEGEEEGEGKGEGEVRRRERRMWCRVGTVYACITCFARSNFQYSCTEIWLLIQCTSSTALAFLTQSVVRPAEVTRISLAGGMASS